MDEWHIPDGYVFAAQDHPGHYYCVQIVQHGNFLGPRYALRIVLRDQHHIAFEAMDLSVDSARSLAQMLTNLATAAEHLEQQDGALSPASQGPTRLPSIVIGDQEFYIDMERRQLRNVENPLHCFNLDWQDAR
jgi:hypothetical protein